MSITERLLQTMVDVIFMTDDTEVYYKAWCKVMGQPAHRLLCTWHVDRAWRKNLPKIRGDKQLKTTIYKTIRALMEIPDRNEFDNKLKLFLATAKSDANTIDFAVYFENEYANRVELWSFNRRLGLHVNHNMHLEALHRVIKHVHMQGRRVKRMDKSLFALTKLMRRKMYDRILKLHKGKWTRHVSGIWTRHRRSTCLDNGLVHCVIPNRVYSVGANAYNSGYRVEAKDHLPHSERLCPIQCSDCNICVHYFSCSCLDSGLRNTICKHVHLVMRAATPEISNIASTTEGCTDVEAVEDSQVTTQCDLSGYEAAPHYNTEESIASSEDPMPIQSETAAILGITNKQQLQTSLSLADEHMHSIRSELLLNPEIAPTICQELRRVRALCSALKARPQLPSVSQASQREPANKFATQQRQFMSTKSKPKKRKPDLNLSKPSKREKTFLLESLEGTIEVISQDRRDTDHDYDVCTGQIVDFEHSY